MNYRREIDGLRALAVMPVILFHAGIEIFGGGFVGVDIFFVISGYLITTILIEDIANDRFSIINFYERRARRILPALFFVIIISIPFAWMWMLPSEMKDFSKSVIAVSLFVSNIFFSNDSDYFAAAADEKPLLHTWSLGVEEQYYLLFPIFLLFAWRLGKNRVFWVIVVLAAISLIASEWGWRNKPSANFYLAPTRAWELLAGSIAAFIVQKRGVQANNKISWIGLIAILFAIFLYDEKTPFPSMYALVPVLGAVLIILYADEKTVVAKLLGSKLPVGIGLISYSAYLVHQPVFSFFRIQEKTPPNQLSMLLLTVSCFLLSIISWKYIENPFRDKYLVSRRQIFSYSLSFILIFVCFGYLGKQLNGFDLYRFSESELKVLNQSKNRSGTHAVLGNKSIAPKWILLGDSHADTLQDALDQMLNKLNESALVNTVNGCPPALNLWRQDKDYGLKCHNAYLKALETIKKHGITEVVISARYALYVNSTRFDNLEGGVEPSSKQKVIYDKIEYKDEIRSHDLRSTAVKQELISFVKNLSDLGVNTFIFASIPEVGWNVPEQAFRQISIHTETKTNKIVYEKRVEPLMSLMESFKNIPNVIIVDTSKVFCDETYCYATENGIPLYFDSNHLNRNGATLLINYFYNSFIKITKN